MADIDDAIKHLEVCANVIMDDDYKKGFVAAIEIIRLRWGNHKPRDRETTTTAIGALR